MAITKKLKLEVETESSTTTTLPYLPEELVIENILTRLPAKPLVRFKSVSKNWHHVISSDKNFAIKQSSNNSSTASSKGIVFVHVDRELTGCRRRSLKCLSLLDHTQIGIPDPSLDFLSLGCCDVSTVSASTNGLLCVVFNGLKGFLHVCNPVTMERDQVPYSYEDSDSVGLVFDPSTNSPSEFKIIQPIRRHIFHENNNNVSMEDGVGYGFDVFSSCSEDRRWISSSQNVILPANRNHYKSVYAKGVVYWHCTEYLLWFDSEKDLAGWILLPHQELYVKPEIGVSEGRVTCTQVSGEGLEVWELVGDIRAYSSRGASTSYEEMWALRHCISIGKMVEENRMVRMSTRRRMRAKRISGEIEEFNSHRLLEKLYMHPLPFQGGEKVHLRVTVRPKTEEEFRRRKWEIIVSFDLRTGVSTTCSGGVFPDCGKIVFGFDCNLAPVPKLS